MEWLINALFDFDPEADVPSEVLKDDTDFVPSARELVFGHHFSSIAGTRADGRARYWRFVGGTLWQSFVQAVGSDAYKLEDWEVAPAEPWCSCTSL